MGDFDGGLVDLTGAEAPDSDVAAGFASGSADYDVDALLRDDPELRALRAQEARARADVSERQRALSSAKNELQRITGAASARVKALVDNAERRIDWIGRAFPWDAVLLDVLRDTFGISSFRPLQREALNAVLSARDVLAVLPTGHGKSLIYQVAAVVERGVTVVVSPLVALIHDQTAQLSKLGISTHCLDAGTSKEDASTIFSSVLPPALKAKGQDPISFDDARSSKSWARKKCAPHILFVTPERIAKSKKLMSRLQISYAENRLTRFTIDEAHCVSNWGHDFRHDYTQLGVLKRMFPSVPTLCLTATATEKVAADVNESLGIRPVVFRGSVDRPNLFYAVRRKTPSVVEDIASAITGEFAGESGILYVLSRKDAIDVANELRTVHGISARSYHGDLSAQERSTTYLRWCSGRCQVVVATIAFGLGIDKQDCRFVIHKDLPSSLEGYYQESGRAGRDGKPAKCIIYFKPADTTRLSSFVADKGRKRLGMVYESAMYCLGRSRARPSILEQEGGCVIARRKRAKLERTCRRAVLAQAFGEASPPRFDSCAVNQSDRASLLKQGYLPNSECCDLCAGIDKSGETALVDVTAEAIDAVTILRSQSLRNPDENITLARMASEWGNTGKKGVEFRGGNSALPRYFDKETRSDILLMCVLDGVLAEYHTYGMYNMLAYIRVGDNADALEAGVLQISLEVEKTSPLYRARNELG